MPPYSPFASEPPLPFVPFVADMLDRYHVFVLSGVDLVAARVAAACMVILLISESEEYVPMALESGLLSDNRRVWIKPRDEQPVAFDA